MHFPTLIKYLVVAWGVPLAIVFVAVAFTPDPNKTRSDFSEQRFKPAQVWVADGMGRRLSDHFELRIQSPAGEEFFHRNPEREPIAQLFDKFPKDGEVRILYSPSVEGNVLMEIAPSSPSSPPVLSFESVMNEYASRRRFVYIVAAIWFGLANLIAFALWKVDVSSPTGNRSEQGADPSA